MLSTVLIGIAALSFLASGVGSTMALVVYLRRPGASLFGFGFANYFHGEMRRERPTLFRLSIGGALLGIAAVLLAAVLR